MSHIRPYNDDWVRVIDLITPLNIQQNLDPHLMLNYYEGEVSVAPTDAPRIPRRPMTTDLGVTITRDPINRNKTRVEYGSIDNPTISLSQREIWNDVVEHAIIDEVPTVVGRRRGVVEPVKDTLASVPALDGCNAVYRLERSRAHMTGVITRGTRLPVSNPCSAIKNDLIEQDFYRANDPILRRMKSVFRTEWMIGLPTKGWSDLGIQGIADASIALTENKFHEDVAVPQEISGTLVGDGYIQAQIYRLLRRGLLLAIGGTQL